MEKVNMRGLILGSTAVIVLTQVACTAWLAREVAYNGPADNSAEIADFTEQLAGVESAISDVQGTADNIEARTGALTNSMGSVARACAFR
jgi:hypothetical protein